MKKIATLIALIMIFSFLSSCGELDDESSDSSDLGNASTPLFWKVSGNGYDGNFYLLGSIHVGLNDANLYPEKITDAWNSCDYLAVETDVISLEKDISASTKALSKLVYADGTKIYDHIEDDTYSKSVDILKRYKIYNSFLDYYMPVLWTQFIEDCLLSETKFDISNGVDRYFLSDAKENGKQILEVEDYLDTYEGLASLSELTQKLLLESYIDDEYAENYEADVERLYSAWKSGDIEYLEEIFINDTDIDIDSADEEIQCEEEYNAVMLDDRNIIMTEKADSYIKNGYDVFYIVGLAHMLGDNGIVESLRGLGYDVELVNLK